MTISRGRSGREGYRHSIATVCLSGILEDKLTAAAAAGFDGVELFENDLITSHLRPKQIAAMASDLGLSIELYQPFRDGDGLPPERFPPALRRFERKLDIMTELDVSTILVCSSVGPDVVPNDATSIENLRQLADVAAARGCRIAFEALAWGSHVSTWDHSWDIVRQADHPALGLCLDSFHIGSRSSSLARLDEVPAEKLFFVQLADAPRLDMDVVDWSRHHRVFPGQGSFDLTEFTWHVLAAGYEGPLSLEVFNDIFRQADPVRTAVDARRSLLVLADSVSRRDPDRDWAVNGKLPDPVPVAGVDFVELAVDGLSGPAVADALRTLGFIHTGQHRSKPVELWEQAEARIVLNSAVVRVEQEPGLADIHGVAVSCTDPDAAARRAEALLAARMPHRRGSGESDLVSVLAPDGSEVIFCQGATATQPASWSVDFLPTGEQSQESAWLRSVDHVALSPAFDHFDEAGLYYRSVLGLIADTTGEVAAPYGLLRTHAVADPQRVVRIALSVARLRRGEWTPGVPSPQHVAFTTPDLLATIRMLRQRGAPLLAIPENYYDDLDARLRLPARLLESLREANALYDRNNRGEFMHAYTEIIGGRIFFEIVQRVGSYDGYGEVNTPTRMAAHRWARLSQPSSESPSA